MALSPSPGAIRHAGRRSMRARLAAAPGLNRQHLAGLAHRRLKRSGDVGQGGEDQNCRRRGRLVPCRAWKRYWKSCFISDSVSARATKQLRMSPTGCTPGRPATDPNSPVIRTATIAVRSRTTRQALQQRGEAGPSPNAATFRSLPRSTLFSVLDEGALRLPRFAPASQCRNGLWPPSSASGTIPSPAPRTVGPATRMADVYPYLRLADQ